jgi:hypothetical protein
MKKQAYTLIALLVLLGGMAVAAQAQMGNHTELVATIPFEFNVGNKAMPAGEYLVSQMNPASSLTVLQLRSRDGKAAAMIQMNTIIATSRTIRAVLNFNRYGNHYFFAQAWMPGSNGLAALKGRAERAAQKELAGVKAQTDSEALRTR